MARELSAVIAIITIGIALLIGLAVAGEIVDTSPTGEQIESSETREPAALSGDDFYVLDGRQGASGTNEVVYNTTGYLLRFDGEDDSDIGWESGLDTDDDDTYTLCTFGALNTSTSARTANRTLLTAQGNAVLSYRNATGGDEWHVFIYDPTSRTSTQFTASATNETEFDQMCIYRNNTDVRLYKNATLLANTTFSESGTAGANLTTQNWHGTVEETRFFADPLNATERNQTVDSPTQPLTTANRTDRIYYDAGEGDSAYVFLAPGEPQAATFANATWVEAGFDGAQMDNNGDYDWQEEPPAVRREGGDLTDQPAAWVDYDLTVTGITAGVVEGVANAFSLARIVLLALGGLLLLVGIRTFRGGV